MILVTSSCRNGGTHSIVRIRFAVLRRLRKRSEANLNGPYGASSWFSSAIAILAPSADEGAGDLLADAARGTGHDGDTVCRTHDEAPFNQTAVDDLVGRGRQVGGDEFQQKSSAGMSAHAPNLNPCAAGIRVSQPLPERMARGRLETEPLRDPARRPSRRGDPQHAVAVRIHAR
jgi:hypothetical protein